MRWLFVLGMCLGLAGLKAQTAKTPFTRAELAHLRVQTPGLFKGRKQVTIRLDSLDGKDFCFPLPGSKVISAYGSRGGRHTGYDLKTKANDTIRSVFAGIVRMSKPYAAYGNIIVIRHADGLESVYSHQSKNLVQCGDTVYAGQAIGLTGRTGRATTEHLHLEFRVNGQHFNPNMVLDFKKHCLKKCKLLVNRTDKGISVKQDITEN